MPRKPHVRTLMGSPHFKGSKALHKAVRQYFSHIFWSLWKKCSSKKFVLVVSEMLTLFVNILTPDDKYSLSKRECLMKPIQMLLTQSQKIFFCISEIYIKFGILWKKRQASKVICFWNYRRRKAGLLKCQKSPVSKLLRTGNVVKGRKHCINLHGIIFVIFLYHSEKESARKSLF